MYENSPWNSLEMNDHDYRHSLTNHVPQRYNKHADFVYSSKFTGPVLDLLGAKAGERIIDLGCGTGELTENIKDLVGDDGEVWAVDSSESMVCVGHMLALLFDDL